MSIQLQCLGGGKMGEAIVRGLLSSGWAQAGEILVVEALPARREELRQIFPGLKVGENLESGIDVLLAIKPQDVKGALEAEVQIPRLLSIAAGVRIEVLQSLLQLECRVLRAMPNTPALLGVGMAGVAAGSSVSEDDLSWAKRILAAVGKVVVVEEELLDAVTGVSGSGPAYLFLVAEAMIAAGVEAGLEPEVADILTRQTLLGSAMLLAQGEDPPEQLRENVTSPGGTTAEALRVFEERGLLDIFREAILAATERSKELGG